METGVLIRGGMMLVQADFLTCREAGNQLGLTEQRVSQLVRAGVIKATRPRNSWPWLLDPESVEALKKERESASTATRGATA